MGVQPPFLYDEVRSSKSFDPRAVSRQSQQPKPQRPKHEGPLISFNQHPDSYLILPYGTTHANPMKASTKKWIKWLRIVQLVFRSFELICASGLLAIMILLRGMDTSTGWILRIAPGIAIGHCFYGVYHLSRRASGRTPASSASYMLFAAFFDVSLLPCYAFGASISNTAYTQWRTILSEANQTHTGTFVTSAFYAFTTGAGFHLVTLIVGIKLAIIFRRITQMPPDMNPLEDNLTSRHTHKRNKSSVSTFTVNTNRTSTPVEAKRASKNEYEDLSQPPTIPFFHTRTQSTDSFSTYKSTPPPSRDSLPSRQYGIQPGNSGSTRSSVVDLKRSSYYSPQKKRGSYTGLPHSESPNYQVHSTDESDAGSFRPSPRKAQEAWFANDSFTSRSAQKPTTEAGYQALSQPYDMSTSDLSTFSHGHPNPVGANPPMRTKRSHFPRGSTVSSNSPLSEISTNRHSSSNYDDGDIADNYMSVHQKQRSPDPVIKEKESFKAKYYGELKPGTPPVMIGGGDLGLGKGGRGNARQVSSGVDYYQQSQGAGGKSVKRDVSGKIAEEGRATEASGWGTRMRKVSGVLM